MGNRPKLSETCERLDVLCTTRASDVRASLGAATKSGALHHSSSTSRRPVQSALGISLLILVTHGAASETCQLVADHHRGARARVVASTSRAVILVMRIVAGAHAGVAPTDHTVLRPRFRSTCGSATMRKRLGVQAVAAAAVQAAAVAARVSARRARGLSTGSVSARNLEGVSMPKCTSSPRTSSRTRAQRAHQMAARPPRAEGQWSSSPSTAVAATSACESLARLPHQPERDA